MKSQDQLTTRLIASSISQELPGYYIHNYYLRDNNKLHKLHRLFDNRLFYKLMLFTLLLVEGIYGTANQAVFSSNKA